MEWLSANGLQESVEHIPRDGGLLLVVVLLALVALRALHRKQ